ncbi:MAG: beta-galactosidase [Lachnospiraceae bacterium]|jgi:beta-galactosidase|nr:beta-galactosidase [Lachnospiraceae bacterium]
MRSGYLMHGGDYNPEQWLDMSEVLDTDIVRFREAKINTVTVGIFSWAKLEPKEGEYRFEWLEEIIDRLHGNGISVILATPSGARPHWMADKYPEVLRVNAMRQRNLFGGRHNHCLSSPIYREKVRRINTELVKRLGAHPAVKMWHISNELGGECHCELCQKAFRGWLKKKYQTIEALNKSWWTTFWSHTYDSFDQIESPSPLGEMSVTGLKLDWRRFISDQTIDYMEDEIRAIRDAGSDLPVTTNLMYHFYEIDYFRLAEKIDIASWDNYPSWHKREEWETARDTAFWHDVIRSLKRKPFFLMESCPGATNWKDVSKLKRPGMLTATSLQSIAHGSDGAMYFQMRKGRGAAEKLHGAVIDHYDGNDTRTFRDVCEAGEMLEALSEVAGTTTKSEAAVIFDWDNRWALDGSEGPRNKDLHYQECVEKSYRALRRQGLNVDVIDQKCSLAPYRFVAAPMQYLFHEGFAEKVREFVEKGGTFVLTYWSGVVDENDLCFLGGTPHGLMDVFGLRSEEIDSLYDEEENLLCRTDGTPDGMKDSYVCRYLCQLVKPADARTLMTYGRDFYAGTPALLENDFGEGKAYYVCADAEQAFYDDFYERLTKEAGISPILPIEIPDGVEVTSRSGENADYIFFQNFNRRDMKVQLPEGEVIFGDKEGNMKPLGNIVVKISR